jgi:hypothetical protein
MIAANQVHTGAKDAYSSRRVPSHGGVECRDYACSSPTTDNGHPMSLVLICRPVFADLPGMIRG